MKDTDKEYILQCEKAVKSYPKEIFFWIEYVMREKFGKIWDDKKEDWINERH